MPLSNDAKALIESSSFDEIESIWMNRLESGEIDVDDFLSTAKMLRQANERSRSDALLELLADALRERNRWPERLRVLREIGRLSKKPATLRPSLEETLIKTYSSRPSFKKVMDFIRFSEPSGNPVEKAEKVDAWMNYEEGEVFFMAGRGVGVVSELNPELGVCRVDFEREKRVSVPLGAAQKFLTPIPREHVLRAKIDAPEQIRADAFSSPSNLLGAILRSFGRTMTTSEIRDALIGIVYDEKWGSWWTSARKNPQVVASGSGPKASYAWTESAGEAEGSIRKDFDQASVRERLELARKHSSRTKTLADHFSSTLADDAARLSKSDPALAWEVFTTLEKLPGTFETTIDPKSLLSGPMAAKIVAAIPDRLLREKAIKSVRDHHPDWPKVFGEVFFLDEDPRVLSLAVSLLENGERTDVRDRLIDETLRFPRRHPRAFYWYCRRISDAEKLPERANANLFWQMLEALTADEFAPLRARMKDFFDKGELAVKIIMNTLDEDQARKFVDTLERYGVLEEYRRDNLRAAAHMRYPSLREPQAEPIYTTAESLATKRAELENLVKVEIPANSKAIQVAREMGDLRENFEYKAARQRAEYLAARVGQLKSELSRARVLEPSHVDISEIRIGTKIALRNGDVQREVTILGPWESSPEHGVYSNQSDVAKALMGHRVGDIVTFMGNDYEVEKITTWR
ncbi:MAG TPA: GreA/GreB family elongation factor [Thermoanaerobaculia bacterium]